jgi:hypothetical protein
VLEGLPESAWTVKLLVPEVVNGRVQFDYFGEHSRES